MRHTSSSIGSTHAYPSKAFVLDERTRFWSARDDIDVQRPGTMFRAVVLVISLGACVLSCSNRVADDDGYGSATASGALTVAYRINNGGGAVTPFARDQYVTGGGSYSTTRTVSVTNVANGAPMAVYQTEHYGDHTYTFGNLTAGATYTVRLHFAEIYFRRVGDRVFNVLINGVRVLTNFDMYAIAGADKAIVRDFTITASSTGTLTVRFANVVEDASSGGIEIFSGASSEPPDPTNQRPTIAAAASATPNPTITQNTALRVLGADDRGEPSLVYTWATTGTPPAPVSFSANGTNAAKTTTATFSKAGTYSLSATIRDASGATATSNVSVAVDQQLSSITVSPATAQVAPGGTRRFTASGADQFGAVLTTQPAFAWSNAGGGTIDSTGLFTAGSTAGGPYTINATSGGKTGNASVTIASGSSGAFYTTNFNLAEYPLSEGGAWRHTGLDWTFVRTSGGLAYGTQTGNGGYDDSYAYLSGFPPNQMAEGVVQIDPDIDHGTYHEVEILLRWADGAHTARGYECNFAYDGQYADIIRWNGPRGNFTFIVPTLTAEIPGGLQNGDVVSAKIVGNRITTYVNGEQILTATDNTFTDGNPGIGFFRADPSEPQNDFSFTSFTARAVTQ